MKDLFPMKDSGYVYAHAGFYQEPAWFVEQLAAVEKFPGGIYDPFCGEGTIPKVFAKHGPAFGTDIFYRGYGTGDVPFLNVKSSPAPNIVSNPNYLYLQQYIDHALTLVSGKVAIIARLAFLASQTRREWFLEKPLARVWIASRRPSMPPGGQGIKASGGSIDFCWLVFEHGHQGKPTIDWLPIL